MDTVAYTNPLNTLALSTARSTNFIPVMLPIGPVTMASIGSASTGLFVPFFLFVCFMFSHLYSIWRSNVVPIASKALRRAAAPPPTSYIRRQAVNPAFFAGGNEYSRMMMATSGNGFF